ncbi:MAG: bifunctional glutamate N-acetyltransferase/amino-acid acetyltransferase ArgJ [Gammaproteobacteria bacterium]
MAVGLPAVPELHPVAGIRLGTAAAGIRKPDRADLLIIEMQAGGLAAAAFTRNRFCAAPVQIARKHLQAQSPRYCLINSGNANAGTGTAGYQAALDCCAAVAALTATNIENILPFSTGVIGEPLPLDRIYARLPDALADLGPDNWLAAARAIMTTDTLPKGYSLSRIINGQTVTFTGIAKGAGMIKPNMATMLAFMATDAQLPQDLIQNCLDEVVDKTFNRITIDGDTSTNDACLLLASGKSVTIAADDTDALNIFRSAVFELASRLAQAVVRDGEGATRFVTIAVAEGQNEHECLQIAYAIAESPLVKTALFAADPNWGRILAAIGRSGPEDMDINLVTIHLDDVCLAREGGRALDYQEAAAQAVMSKPEFTIHVNLGRGNATTSVWTCDLSYDYVRINAEYRT